MDSYSSILNEEKNTNRSDLSRMNNIDRTRLVRLRPDKFDDVAVKEQISLIQQACADVDPEIIALVFHECDYNMQQTIARIQAGEFQDDGWQTAKSTNKKKSHNQGDHILNGGTFSDSERSLSQRTSPTSSLRDGHRRNDQYQYPSSIRTDVRRRGHDPGRNQFNSRYSNRTNPPPKPIPPIPSETSLPAKQSNEGYEFVEGSTQSLTFENSQTKASIPSSSKRRIPSVIPQEPVSMHPTVQYSSKPVDIQFGDIQWNNSVLTAVLHNHEEEEEEEEISSIINTENQDSQNIDHQLLETTNQLSSSLSITDNTISNNNPIVSPESTSHLSDQLTNTSSSIPNPYSSQSQEPVQIPITRLPPTSTPHTSEYTSPTSQFIPTNNVTSSAFTPFNRTANYASMPTNWTAQQSNYKTASKTTMIPAGTYSPQQQQQQQHSYQIPPHQQQQQQIYFGTYPYSTLSPTVVQVFAPIEHWSPSGYSTALESYPYATANYIPTYPNQPQYHSYDKEYFAHYGQPRPSANDLSYQQSSISSQPTKETQSTSKLSPSAATFSQGAPLTASPSATALYINPVPFSMPHYYPSMGGTTHQDRTLSYPSVDNRDNRNGAPYSGTNNRTNYYHPGQQQQQQRTHNNNVSNSTWHLQQ